MARQANTTFKDHDDSTMTHGPVLCEEYCHHHLWNTPIKNGLNIPLSKHLTEKMKTDLDEMDNGLRVNTNFDAQLQAIDKCFSLCCNYPKCK